MSSHPESREPGKVHDPVFLCMIAAIILAVVSSIALRAMVAHSGPAAARGDTTDASDTSDTNQPKHHAAATLVNAEPK